MKSKLKTKRQFRYAVDDGLHLLDRVGDGRVKQCLCPIDLCLDLVCLCRQRRLELELGRVEVCACVLDGSPGGLGVADGHVLQVLERLDKLFQDVLVHLQLGLAQLALDVAGLEQSETQGDLLAQGLAVAQEVGAQRLRRARLWQVDAAQLVHGGLQDRGRLDGRRDAELDISDYERGWVITLQLITKTRRTQARLDKHRADLGQVLDHDDNAAKLL